MIRVYLGTLAVMCRIIRRLISDHMEWLYLVSRSKILLCSEVDQGVLFRQG